MVLFAVNPSLFWEDYIIGFVLFTSRLLFDVIVYSRGRVQKSQLKKEALELTKERREMRIRKLKEHKATNDKLEQTVKSLENIRITLSGRGVYVAPQVSEQQEVNYDFKPSLNADISIDTEAGTPLVYDTASSPILAATCQVCKVSILTKDQEVGFFDCSCETYAPCHKECLEMQEENYNCSACHKKARKVKL